MGWVYTMPIPPRTVKPIELMRWLCRLVTPPKGVVLDLFAGSGSTVVAAGLEGLRCIGFELEEDYCAIARARAHHCLGGDWKAPTREERQSTRKAGQIALFGRSQ